MSEYVRVTDEVTPRREYTVHEVAVTDAHKVLNKPATYADGTPIPPKYLAAKLAPKSPASTDAGKHNGGQTSPQEQE